MMTLSEFRTKYKVKRVRGNKGCTGCYFDNENTDYFCGKVESKITGGDLGCGTFDIYKQSVYDILKDL